ncbi:hypothetical protein F2Q69_00034003 [Brassica cretica]|uniref:Uncharacterized protein n=1 Tax=Brassica cretica TaxID=69181 RepID=A0A8S9SK33_BRACR|nr:hypothetical protein F2Q69_00034003 [Brassica cretica]
MPFNLCVDDPFLFFVQLFHRAPELIVASAFPSIYKLKREAGIRPPSRGDYGALRKKIKSHESCHHVWFLGARVDSVNSELFLGATKPALFQ